MFACLLALQHLMSCNFYAGRLLIVPNCSRDVVCAPRIGWHCIPFMCTMYYVLCHHYIRLAAMVYCAMGYCTGHNGIVGYCTGYGDIVGHCIAHYGLVVCHSHCCELVVVMLAMLG